MDARSKSTDGPGAAIASGLKAVAFDLGDTLVEYEGVPPSWEKQYPDALGELAGHLGVSLTPGQVEAGCEVLRGFNTRLSPRIDEVAFATILQQLLARFGQKKRPVEERTSAEAFFRVFRRRLRLFPDSLPALRWLRANKFATGVFTDVPYGMPRELVLEDLKETSLVGEFDVITTSRDAGFRKPSPTPLLRLAEQLGVTPAEMAYVGNERKDVASACAAGCVAILLDRGGVRPRWGQDWTIGSLENLIARD